MEPTFDELPQHSESLSALKEGLSKSVLLHHSSQNTTLSLTTDATETANGAALHVVSSSDKTRPLAFFSTQILTKNCFQFKLQPLNFVMS